MSVRSLESRSPEDTIVALRDGEITEEEAFAVLLEAADKVIIGAVRKKIGYSPNDVSEVAAQVWVEIVKSLPNYDPTQGKFTTWCYRIALNRAIDLFRKLGRQPPTESIDIIEEGAVRQEIYTDNTTRSPLEEVVVKEMIFQAASDLYNEVEGIDYDIYILRIAFGEALTFDQVAQLVNKKNGTHLTKKAAEGRFYRAQKKLREIMLARESQTGE